MTEVVDDIVENVSGFARGLIDKATELGIAAQGFSLKDDNYHDAWYKIRDLYRKVSTARQYLEEQGSRLKPEDVSNRIAGIRKGATNARKALIDQESGSLLNMLRYLETQLSELLTDMHDSYVTYLRTDQESALGLIGAASAADAS